VGSEDPAAASLTVVPVLIRRLWTQHRNRTERKAMRIGAAISDYSGILIGGEACCDRVAFADPTQRGWHSTLTCCRPLLDLRFPHIRRAAESYTRRPLRSCWAGQFVYRITDVAAADTEPVLALLRCSLAK
jgi:hypothetical protein